MEEKKDFLIIELLIKEILRAKAGRRKLTPQEEREILILTNNSIEHAKKGFNELVQYLSNPERYPTSDFGGWIVVSFDRVVYGFKVAPSPEALRMIQFKTLPELK